MPIEEATRSKAVVVMGGKLDASVQDLMDPGETVVTSRPVAPAGDLGRQLGGGAGAGIGGIVGGAVMAAAGAASRPADTLQVHPKTNLLVITDQRIVLVRTQLGRAKEVLASVPHHSVRDLEATKARIAFGKIRIHHEGGHVTELDLKSDRKVDEFLTDARTAVGAGSSI